MLVNGNDYRTVWFKDGQIYTIDQLLLPAEFKIVKISSYKEVIRAIKTMVVRGAPAIGAMGAYGLALGIQNMTEYSFNNIEIIYQDILASRPTAYDLTDGLNTVLNAVKETRQDLKNIQKAAFDAAVEYADKSVEACRSIGNHGNQLIKNGNGILTHCNAGALATVDFGTALAPMRMAHADNKTFFVYVDETRPRLQGAMLTAWELGNEGIKHAIIADNAAGYFFQKGKIDLVITGSDRIARNGDIANKIGTYEKAVLAHHHGIPFYIAAPFTTIDFNCENGESIPIEERSQEEVLIIKGIQVAANGSPALNPAFDVTPAELITGIITEKGIFKPSEIASLDKKNG